MTRATKDNKPVDQAGLEATEQINITTVEATPICGLIRPISTMNDEYTEAHWNQVLKVIDRAVTQAGFKPRTVSDSSYANIIHGSIVNNLYDDPIVVCDVSNKNANVMFELGMRLAFDKPVVIIIDSKTTFSFDTSSYKHLIYPFDLQFNETQDFIDELAQTILETYQASQTNSYTSFLSHYKKINVNASHIEAKQLGTQDIDISDAVEELLFEFKVLRSEVSSISDKFLTDKASIRSSLNTYTSSNRRVKEEFKFTIKEKMNTELAKNIVNTVSLVSANQIKVLAIHPYETVDSIDESKILKIRVEFEMPENVSSKLMDRVLESIINLLEI